MTPAQTSQLIDCLHFIGARLEDISDSLYRIQRDLDDQNTESTARNLIRAIDSRS